MPSHLIGIDGKIADCFNEVSELNQRMADELKRILSVVGKEGKLSQRADLGDVRGAWHESVDCVCVANCNFVIHRTCNNVPLALCCSF
jgi:hypothetical protein